MRIYKFTVVLLVFISSCSLNKDPYVLNTDDYIKQVITEYPNEIDYSYNRLSTDSLDITLPLQLVGLSNQRVGIIDGRTWSLSVVDTSSRLLSRYQSIGNGPEEWLQVNSISAFNDTISLIDGRQNRIIKIGLIEDHLIPLDTKHYKISETGSPRAFFRDNERFYFLFQKNPIPNKFKSNYSLERATLNSEDFTPLLTFTDSDAVRDMTSIMYRLSRILIDIDHNYGLIGINYTDSLVVNLLDTNDLNKKRIAFRVDSNRENSSFNKEYVQNSSATDGYKNMFYKKENLPIVRSFAFDNGLVFLHLYYFGGDHNVILIQSLDDSTTKHLLAPVGFLMYDVIDRVIIGIMTDSISGEQNVAFLTPKF